MKILDVQQTPPDFDLPPGACDCHLHLFGPQARYPLATERQYTPPPVGLVELSKLQKVLKLDRAVAVQASVQGTDNSFLFDALQNAPTSLRAIAVIKEDISDAELLKMEKAGFRGIRLNFESHGISDPVMAGKRLHAAAEKIAPLGWHVQMYAGAELLIGLADKIAGLPCPVVLDHFGRMAASSGLDNPHFKILSDLLQSGKIYIKFSGPHRVSSMPGYGDVKELAAALCEANSDRVLWGSDWPHVLSFNLRKPDGFDPLRPEDDGANLNRLARWIPNKENLRKILVDNPARLYRF